MCFVGSADVRDMPLSSFTRSTIFALSSHVAPRGSPLALVRLSGPAARPAVHRLTLKALQPRTATLCKFRDPRTSDLIDEGIAISYPRPRSYTGEDVCELMVHGSKAIVARLLRILGETDGLRPAEAGEFTKRALLHGKLDMTAAEAVKDLIESRTETQRKRALAALSGKTSGLYRSWRKRLLKCLSDLEANIEFGEDQLIDNTTLVNVKSHLLTLESEIDGHVSQACKKSDLALEGFRVVILGEPNVGKSSLMNALTSRDVSIVSSIAGTTRDVVDVVLDLKGHLITMSDTAGLRELNDSDRTDDAIEREGIRRAKLKGAEAHLILSVSDHDSQPLSSEIQEIQRTNEQVRIVNVMNKCDVLPVPVGAADCLISCKTGQGIDELQSLILRQAEALYSISGQEFITERQSSHLRHVVSYMRQSASFLDNDLSIAAHYLKKSAMHLSSLTDVISNEDVLDVLFRDFCIGK